ncbi:hypothetical protein AAKU55_004818 [Oxalobacteraceae bacterium GrIS 1.11]
METRLERDAAQSLETLKQVELALAQHRAFGSSAYIRQQLDICYRRRLDKIGAALPVAARLSQVLRATDADHRNQIIGDTVLRCAVQHALRQVVTGLPYGLPLAQCGALFQATLEHIAQGKPGGPLLTGFAQAHSLGSEPHQAWIWNEEHADDVFGRAFRDVMAHNYGAPLCSPSAEELSMLARGAQLLKDLLPVLSASALQHVQLIGIFPRVGIWNGKASSSQFRVNGTIFLNRELLGHPWWVAEHLLHESLHQKLYDFRHGHTLLEPDYARPEAPRVCSLWNAPDASQPDAAPSNYWDAHRTIAAFHVYVHLALLCAMAEAAPELEAIYGPLHGAYTMTGRRRAIDRARYLGEQLQQQSWGEMGAAGQRMVAWLMSVLDVLDPVPRPAGSTTHLLVDLYQRQTKKLDRFLQRGTADGTLAAQLRQRIDAEIAGTRTILARLASSVPLERFDGALAQCGEVDCHVPRIRKLISDTLLDLPVMPPSQALDEIVKDMVRHSSAHLSALGVLA